MTIKYYPFDKELGDIAHRVAYAVTPHDTNEIGTFETRAIYIGAVTTGAMVCRLADMSADITFTGLTANTILPLNVSHIRATGTGVSGIIALV